MAISGNDLLSQIENENPKLGQYLRNYVLPAIQTTADNAAVDPESEIAAPAPPESLNIATSGEFLQLTINHVAPIRKGAHYITSIATNPQLSGAMIHDHGPSRAPLPIWLPTKDGSGNTHNYYIATQVQYPGSPPSAPRFYGGVSPVPVTMSGSTQLTLQAGTGSGTAANGGQTLVGLGKAQVRL